MGDIKAWQVDLSDMDKMDLLRLKTKIDKQIDYLASSNFNEGRIFCVNTRNKYELFLGVDGFRNNKPELMKKSIFSSESTVETLEYLVELIEDLTKAKERIQSLGGVDMLKCEVEVGGFVSKGAVVGLMKAGGKNE